jgi:hypothetical protein
MLGVGGLFALQSSLSSHSPRPPVPAIKANARATDVVEVNLTAETGDLSTADENAKKVVTVQRFRIAALNANDEALLEPQAKSSPQPKARVRHRRHYYHHRWRKPPHRN